PGNLPGRWLYLFAHDGSNTSLRESWFSTIESASLSGDKIAVTTQIRDANSSFWLQLPDLKKVSFEIVSQPMLQPRMMRTISDLSAFIEERRQYKVGKVISPADYVATTRFMIRPNEPGSRKIPDSAEEVKLMWDY